MKGFCWLVLGLVFCACGESGRGDDGFTVEQVASDTGFAEFDATHDVDAQTGFDIGIEPLDALADSDIGVDGSALPVDAEITLAPDASPEVDAALVDANLPTDTIPPIEDAGPDSSDPVPDVNLLDLDAEAEVKDGSILDADIPPDASAPDPDEGVEPVDASVEEGLPLNPPLCPNAGVRLESITPSEDFPGLLTVSLDYNNWQGMICFDGECHEGVLDPQGTRYPTALITDRYRVDWRYMIGAGQLESRLWISDIDGSLVVEITGLMGPAGMMNSPGFYDDHGRHFTGESKVNHPTAEDTEVEIPLGTLWLFATCRPDRGP